ncbi:LPS translocon maturation chaperone LptM [Marinobacterium jannaschii]|nr:lipoprotein [Marinobacterium jannaschii]
MRKFGLMLLVSMTLLGGCGQKGDLYLPKGDAQQSQQN